jgi:organic radical activating enzyme
MKNIRKKMLQGESLSTCKRCYDLEAKGISSMRDKSNMEYYKLNTANDGSIPIPMKHLELHFGNVCNLTCKMCSQQFSHLIGRELLRMGTIDPEFLKWVKKHSGVVNNWSGELDVVYDWFKNDKIKKEVFEKISADVDFLSIVGGEPTAIPEFFELLEFCYNNGTLEKKDIVLFTNLTNTNYKLTQWMKKVKKFTIYGSIDGLNERNEYIRYPSKWNKILDSLNFYQELIKNTQRGALVFGPTIQLLNIDHFADMIIFFEQFVEKHQIELNINWTSVVTAPVIYDYLISPADYKQYVIEHLSKKAEAIQLENNKREVLSHVKTLESSLNNQTDRHLINAFIKFNDFQDRFRKCSSWRSLLPKLESSMIAASLKK